MKCVYTLWFTGLQEVKRNSNMYSVSGVQRNNRILILEQQQYCIAVTMQADAHQRLRINPIA